MDNQKIDYNYIKTNPFTMNSPKPQPERPMFAPLLRPPEPVKPPRKLRQIKKGTK